MSWLVSFALVVSIGMCPAAEVPGPKAEGSVNLHQAVDQLRLEVIRLRADLTRLQLELRQSEAGRLRAELESVRLEQIRVADLNQTRERDLRDVEQLLASDQAAPDERQQLEVTRGDLSVSRARQLDHQMESLRERERELTRRFESEVNLIARLTAEVRRISGGAK